MAANAPPPPGTRASTSAAAPCTIPVTIPITSDATAKTPVMAIRKRPMSLPCRKGRGRADSKARSMPLDSEEKTPSALHRRKAPLTMVIPPRDSITASITPFDCLRVERRPGLHLLQDKGASAVVAKEEAEDDDAQNQQLEDGEDAEIGHAAGVLQRPVLHEAGAHLAGDLSAAVAPAPRVEPRGPCLDTVNHFVWPSASERPSPLGRLPYPICNGTRRMARAGRGLLARRVHLTDGQRSKETA